MATIWRTLQKEVFDISDEKLVGILHVTKQGKKKKHNIFLCATINSERPVYASIHQVKEADTDLFKKKVTWPLVELLVVDGKDETKDVPEIDLTFNRVFKWTASSGPEKTSFIKVLWLLCHKYLPKQKPQFINIAKEITVENVELDKGVTAIVPGLVEVEEADSDFVALSDREQYDLEQLMLQCDSAVANAEAFADQLTNDLTVLDGANIHSMMASEAQVNALMEMIDSALEKANKIETRLDSYDEILLHVKDSIEKMAGKNHCIEQSNANSRMLLDCLDSLLKQLAFPQSHEQYLINPDFQPNNLHPVLNAATALEAVINTPIPMHLSHLQAVKEQKKKCDRLKSEFSRHLARHLNNLFIHHGNDPGESLTLHADSLTLPRHSRIHTEVMHYAPLMHWMKSLDPKGFNKLRQTYTSSLAKLYERDTRLFFEESKLRISGSKRLRGSGSNQDIVSMSAVAGKLMHQAQTFGAKSGATGSLLGIERDQWGGELDYSERQKFDEIFEQVLSEMEPVCLHEQEFCIKFFDLNSENKLKSSSSAVMTETVQTEAQKEKVLNKECRAMMSELFPNLEQQLTSFINTFNRADSYCCLYIYVRLSQHVLSAEDTGSFLSTTFGSALVQAKRNFDNFMNLQLTSIRECKVSRKKCGIIPFISNFEEFVQFGESVFGKSDRRRDLNKWCNLIITAMFENIPRIAEEHQRTPRDVVEMENFHALYQLLSQLKLLGSETQRKVAKQNYTDALNAYVTLLFGRPLEKLNLFFEGVTAKVAAGVKESEIGYQLAFNKQELRKVIREYPGKEVKKGLEQLYKKIEKHLSDQGNLIQVVWRAMQGEFIEQYKYIEDMIHRCYPGAMVSLEFTIQDILNYFSDIAQSH